MLIRTLFAVLLVTASTWTVASAQLFTGFQPNQCVTSARASIEGASDGQVVAILAVGATIELGPAPLNIGMDLTDGTSPLWVYLVYSQSLDTVAVVPFIRVLGSCTAPPLGDVAPDFGDTEGLRLVSVPANFVQGAALITALDANGDYATWKAAHPDSTPTITMLATTDEDALGFPAGTPFWALNWIGNEPDALPFICLVHATTAQTICFGEDIVSVDDQGKDGLFAMAPNPASDDLVISLPAQWINRSVSVDAVNVTGQRISLRERAPTTGPQIFVSTHALNTGTWMVRITDGQVVSTMPLVIAR